MNIVSLNGHVFDVDEVIAKERQSSGVAVTFRNGDRILLAWRDHHEREEICRALQLPVDAPPEPQTKNYAREA